MLSTLTMNGAMTACCVVAFAFLGGGRAAAQHLYWSDWTGIHRSTVDGDHTVTVLDDVFATDLALDVAAGQLYWAERGCAGWCPFTPGTMNRANLDGTDGCVLFSDSMYAVDSFTVDKMTDRLYWGGVNLGDVFWTAWLATADTDGSGVQTLLDWPDVQMPGDMVIHAQSQTLYWLDFLKPSGIRHAPVTNLHLSGTIPYVPTASISVLAIDPRARRLFWSDGGVIVGLTFGGTGAAPIVDTGSIGIRELAADSYAGVMYWVAEGEPRPYELWRADTDGSHMEQIMTADSIIGLAVDPRTTGDVNLDGRVDLVDHTALGSCLLGPGVALPNECVFFDVDPSDRDVDLADYAMFQNVVTGPA